MPDTTPDEHPGAPRFRLTFGPGWIPAPWNPDVMLAIPAPDVPRPELPPLGGELPPGWTEIGYTTEEVV